MLGRKTLVRRVLIVSPHFPPVNAPDMQRARIALPYLRQLGWEPVVLAVAPDLVEGAVIDPLLEQTYPCDIRVIRVRGISPKLTRRFGVGSLWWRCAHALRRVGDALLAKENFDLVFFTTTQFDAFTLGPRWFRRFGVPYVLDYQDPWVNDYYRLTKTRPPGGKLRFGLSQFSARRREPGAVRQAAAIISVSSSYGPELIARYSDLAPQSVHHLPFGTAESDLNIARNHQAASPLIPQNDDCFHIVYCGRCGSDMGTSLDILFGAFRRYQETHPHKAARIRFHFIGTDYAPPPLGRFWALPRAQAAGVETHVTEHCYRIPYFEALGYLVRADALMLIGSDDPGYSASKLFPYLYARRSLLTIAHASSLMLELARQQGHTCSFGFASEDTQSLINQVHDQWFVNEGYNHLPQGNPRLLDSFSAETMTRRLVAIFNTALAAPVQ